MKSKKINLEKLKVQSFVTEEKSDKIKGGASFTCGTPCRSERGYPICW